MGTIELCTMNMVQEALVKQIKIDLTAQTDRDFEQQFDNPSRGSVFQSLTTPLILASNNLLQNEKKSQFSEITPQNNQNEQNNYIIDTGYFSTYQQKHQQTEQVQKIRRNSKTIDSSLLVKQNFEFNQTMNTLSSYVIGSKQFYQTFSRISIHHRDFIQIKKCQVKNYYRFQQKIGQGAYGNVYRVICKKNNNIRAIKSLKQNIMPDQKIKQLRMEMDILEQLDHQNIIKLYEIFQEEQTQIFHVVTQYCVGRSLIDYLMLGITFSESQIKTIFLQLLSALNYLHRMKFIHRDLKLQNIVFLNPVNANTPIDKIQIKIIDFGTACKQKNRINFIDHMIGTTSYMAPEIINGYYNQKCDIWSAGIILYILVTGKSPFRGVDRNETLKNIKQHQLTFQQPEWRIFSPECQDLVRRMLVKSPQKRASASSALSHNWFKDIPFSNQLNQQAKTMIINLQKYYRGNNLISKIQYYLIFMKITQQERKKISEIFKILDKNNDGTIDVDELKAAYIALDGMENFSQSEREDQLEYILLKIDKNNSGKIDLSEFTVAVYDRKKLFIKKYLQDAFEYFDSDGSGYIEKYELKSVLQGCDKQQFQSIIKQIDLNVDSKISKEQFLGYLLKMNFMY